MDARAINAKLRQREILSREELIWFANGLADRSVSDAQAGAFAMAVCLNGLGDAGKVALTQAMRDSGDRLQWDLDAPVLDKHSTGGIGDCVSLVLAPALAACGVYVPMISGRGLGHTGGTLDKIEAIPGLNSGLSEARFRHVVEQAGCAIVSASANMAPADKRLYAIRDVTGTVESLDLITASILSKKLAAGLDGLVLDVKLGSGAFMKTPEDARALARSLVDTAKAAGCPTRVVVSDMSQPLARSLGNALEVAETMRVLCDGAPGRLLDLSLELGAILLTDAGVADDLDDGAARLAAAIASGKAAEHWGRMIAAMGGPVQFVDSWQELLPQAHVICEVSARQAGFVTAIDGEALGLAVVALGGGRQVETDQIDPSVGISQVLALGSPVTIGQPLCQLHSASEDIAKRSQELIRRAFTISQAPGEIPPLLHERIG